MTEIKLDPPEDPTPWWNNTKTWRSQDGTVRKLEDLAPLHRYNIIERAHRHAAYTRGQYSWWWMWQVPNPMDGDALHDFWEEEQHRIETQPDDEFIESLPLIKRLREINAPPERKRPSFTYSVEIDLTPVDKKLFRLLTGMTKKQYRRLYGTKEGRA